MDQPGHSRQPEPDTIRSVLRYNITFRVDRPEKIDRDFWAKFENAWESETFELFNRLLKPGARMLDVGGWIGPTALYAAALGVHVHVFEPDPVAYAKLARNVALNPELAGRITLDGRALNTETGEVELHSKELGNSMSGMVHGTGENRRETVRVPALDIRAPEVREAFETADLVKIDIEGGEFQLLPRIADWLEDFHPTLYLSLHGFFLPENDPDRTKKQDDIVALIATYPHVYQARKGAWRKLGPDAETIAAELTQMIGDGGLKGSVLLTAKPVEGLTR